MKSFPRAATLLLVARKLSMGKVYAEKSVAGLGGILILGILTFATGFSTNAKSIAGGNSLAQSGGVGIRHAMEPRINDEFQEEIIRAFLRQTWVNLFGTNWNEDSSGYFLTVFPNAPGQYSGVNTEGDPFFADLSDVSGPGDFIANGRLSQSQIDWALSAGFEGRMIQGYLSTPSSGSPGESFFGMAITYAHPIFGPINFIEPIDKNFSLPSIEQPPFGSNSTLGMMAAALACPDPGNAKSNCGSCSWSQVSPGVWIQTGEFWSDSCEYEACQKYKQSVRDAWRKYEERTQEVLEEYREESQQCVDDFDTETIDNATSPLTFPLKQYSSYKRMKNCLKKAEGNAIKKIKEAGRERDRAIQRALDNYSDDLDSCCMDCPPGGFVTEVLNGPGSKGY